MLRARLARQLALLVFAALCPALAFALDETYEGTLQPDNRDPRIPIIIELHDLGASLKGNVQTSAPYKGDAPIESGANVFGQCSVNVVLSKTVTLRLDGSCEQTAFTGTYMLWDTQKRTVTRGDFRLTRKVQASAKVDDKSNTKASANSAAACLKSNTQCMLACPRGDTGVEFMCSSHCRAKFRTCKSRIKRPVFDAD